MGSVSAPLFDGLASLSGRIWTMRTADEGQVRRLAQTAGLIDPLARAVVGRGMGPETVSDYLNPTLKALFPDPMSFRDMDRAAEAIVEAIKADRSVYVFADYDVDGATSGALLVRWFRALGRDLPIYVPDRLTEGYGPSPAAFAKLKSLGADLVITVDCGAAAYEAVMAATEMGLDVVVIDHHLMKGAPPACRAVVNPNRTDCNSGQGVLAAAGVVFVALAALNRAAEAAGLFQDRSAPDLRQWLDLAALGAVCDVTTLTGFNRALTAQGLKVMARWQNTGLRTLMQVAQGKDDLPDLATTFTAGFLLGPRINAGGRIGRADLGLRLLSTDDPTEARDLALQLHELNAERKAVEAAVTEAAAAQVEARGDPFSDDPAIVVSGDDWHPGVIGIVAGRLRERWRKPVVVIGTDPISGMGKGSGRSQPGFNLGRAIQKAGDDGVILGGGGHAMAAGLTLKLDQIEAFRTYLNTALAGEQAGAVEADRVEIDALISPGRADRALLDAFQVMAPFGPGNPEPMFALMDVRVAESSALKGGHVRCTLTEASGGRIKAMAWRAAETPLGQRLLARDGTLCVAGRLKPDDYMGRNGVQFEIEDIFDPRCEITK